MAKDKRNYFEDISSKISKVYIELHNYSFFHSPSETSQSDRRFIGRDKIKRKLKAILIDSATKSGAYLITGFRGMGKTSFINKTLEEINPFQKPLSTTVRFVRIWLFSVLTFLLLFFLSELSELAFLIGKILMTVILSISLLSWYLKYEQQGKINNTNKDRKLYTLLIIGFVNLLPLRLINIRLHKSKNKFNIPSYLYYQEVIIAFIVISIFILFKKSPLFNDLKNISFVILSYSVASFSFLIGRHIFGIHKFKKAKGNKFRNIKIDFVLFFRTYFYGSNNIFIKVNLSYDNLQVRDILKLVSNNIEDSYLSFNSSLRRNFIKKTLFSTSILLLTFFVYYNPLTYQLNHEIKDKLKVYYFFPSQLPFATFDSRAIDDACLITFKNNSTSNHEFIDKTFNHSNTQDVHLTNNYQLKTETLFSQEEIIEFNGKTESLGQKNFIDDTIKGNVKSHKQQKWICTIQNITIHIDLFIYIWYSKFREIINHISFNLLNRKISYVITKSTIFPHVDYAFVFYYFLLFYFVKLFFLLPIFYTTSPKKILKQIRELNEMIDAQITQERGSSVNTGLFPAIFSIFSRKSKKMAYADEREIERRIIDILCQFDKLPFLYNQPTLIFIFDELDKIQPHRNINISQKEEEGESQNNHDISFNPEGTRKRQQTVLNLFSNLKSFLTTAKAKFIFIGGRELYDASLADISDRNYFIGSIFHDVLYVESFLSDISEGENADITSMTERYVCQFLFPQSYINSNNFDFVQGFSLQQYNQYLIKSYGKTFDENMADSEFNAKIARQKREKIIFLLKQFIVFLTHSSNGSPKKITRFLENYIEKNEDRKKLENDKTTLSVSTNKLIDNLFLAFDYYEQLKLGTLFYLTYPIILTISNSSKHYGDKLLVSSSFLVDHLFKFHRNAFSWRNLEHTPEIIDINKTPELRGFISEIINYLNRIHMEEIVSGLYQFKFRKKISREINFLSKVREDVAAAFNFTLDESLAIKQHYQRKLQQLQDSYSNQYGQAKRENFINSIASQHMILGDLHFYDEEYNEAIIEYQDAIQFLKNKVGESDFSVSEMVLLIRNMLKLGFAYEKRKTYDTAFVTYGELTALLIQFRHIDLEEVGLEERRKENITIVAKKRKVEFDRSYQPYSSTYYQEGKAEDLPKLNEKNDVFSGSGQALYELVNRITPNVAKLLFKASSFEGLRLMYQPLLVQLHIIEKGNLGGITAIDVKRVVQEFLFITKTLRTKEKYIITSEFYNKLGDILFYKNGLQNSINVNKNDNGDKIYLEEISNNESIIFCKDDCNENCNEKRKYNKYSCWACNYYIESLKNIIKNFTFEIINGKPVEIDINSHNDIIEKTIHALKHNNFDSKRINSIKLFAKTLSNYGDTLLSCYSHESLFSCDDIETFLKFINDKNYALIKSGSLQSAMFRILIINYISAIFYKKADEFKEYSFQITKILYIIRDYLFVNEKKDLTLNLNTEEIKDVLVKKAIKGIYLAYESIHRFEVNLTKKMFKLEKADPYGGKNISLEKISINDELEEINIVFTDILLLEQANKKERGILCQNDYLEQLARIVKKDIVSTFNLNDNAYNRILRLRLKTHVNYRVMHSILDFHSVDVIDFELDFCEKICEAILFNEDNKVIYKNIKELFPFIDSKDFSSSKDSNLYLDSIEYLITDSIFCHHEIIKLSKLYGVSYLLNHSFIGITHTFLSQWITIYMRLIRVYEVLAKKGVNDIIKTEFFESKKAKVKTRIKGKYKEHLRKVKNHLANKTLSPDILNEILNEEINYFLKTNENLNKFPQKVTTIEKYSSFENCQKELEKFRDNEIEYFNDKLVEKCKSHYKEIKESWKGEEDKKIKAIKERYNNFKQTLFDLVELQSVPFLFTNYQSEEAIRHLSLADAAHNEGKSYKVFTENMFYLNDDLNDNLDHFFAALERFKLNSNFISDRIIKQKTLHKESGLYDYENYLKTNL